MLQMLKQFKHNKAFGYLKINKMELQEILKYYLGTELNIKWDSEYGTTHKTLFTIVDWDWLINKQKGKPLMRSLSKLTEHITVKGYNNNEPFVTIEEILKTRDCDAEYDFISALEDDWASADTKMNFAPFSIMKKLISWHFNVFNLPEDKFIEIQEDNNGN